jgi:hypothetical protein
MTSPSNLKTPETQRVTRLKYETDRYYIQIGRSIGLVNEDVLVYQIINKEYELIEGESIGLDTALLTLGTRTQIVKDYEDALAQGAPPIESPPTGGTVH